MMQPAAAIQHARQIVVRHIAVDAPLFQRFQVGVREKSAVGAHSLRTFAASSFHLIDHRQQRFIVVSLLAHPLRDDQMIPAHRQRPGITQHESTALPQKPAVRIAPRNLLHPAFLQALQPHGNFSQLPLQLAKRFPAYLHPGSFVRILPVTLLLPAANLPPQACPFVTQRPLAVDSIP